MKKLFLFLAVVVGGLRGGAQDYRVLHAKAIVVDTHNDVLSEAVIGRGLDFSTDLTGKTHSDLGRFKKGGVDVQVFSIFCNDRFGVGSAFHAATREIDSLYAVAARNKDKMVIVTDVAGVMRVVQQHKLAAMMGVEGGHMIEDRMDYLDSFFVRGVRYMTLTGITVLRGRRRRWRRLPGRGR